VRRERHCERDTDTQTQTQTHAHAHAHTDTARERERERERPARDDNTGAQRREGAGAHPLPTFGSCAYKTQVALSLPSPSPLPHSLFPPPIEVLAHEDAFPRGSFLLHFLFHHHRLLLLPPPRPLDRYHYRRRQQEGHLCALVPRGEWAHEFRWCAWALGQREDRIAPTSTCSVHACKCVRECVCVGVRACICSYDRACVVRALCARTHFGLLSELVEAHSLLSPYLSPCLPPPLLLFLARSSSDYSLAQQAHAQPSSSIWGLTNIQAINNHLMLLKLSVARPGKAHHRLRCTPNCSRELERGGARRRIGSRMGGGRGGGQQTHGWNYGAGAGEAWQGQGRPTAYKESDDACTCGHAALHQPKPEF
jgi:hypothetical protein